VKISPIGALAPALFYLLAAPCWAQFQNEEATLLQPRTTLAVVVPPASIAGLDFDWSDVPGATSYKLEVIRHLEGGGTGIDSVTSTLSRALYGSVLNPLVPGTSASPTQYSWRVTAFQGMTASRVSDEFTFGLIGGSTLDPPKPAPGPSPPPAPIHLSPVAGVEYTAARVSSESLVMRWDPVPGAIGYEVQLVREKNENGATVENLHYRVDVAGAQAVVTNLTLFGTYRFEVRTIASGDVRGSAQAVEHFSLVTFLASDIYPEPPAPDGLVNELDLLSFARNWHLPRDQAQNPHADIVSQDRFIDQADLVAFLIQFHGAPLSFPQPRQTPTPGQLDPPQLNLPSDQGSFSLPNGSSTINFSWNAVANAQTYSLYLSNATTTMAEFFDTADTQISIMGTQFLNELGGGGNYTWQVLASAPGYTQSQSLERTFSLDLGFSKAGKAASKDLSLLEGIKGFLFGEPAQAEEANLDKVLPFPPPKLIFPTKHQCLDTMSPFPLMWTEVPNATSYALEVTLPVGNTLHYLSAQGVALDAENFSIITDSQPGDGIVSALFFSTFRSKNYRFRVQARFGAARGEFSLPRRFEISSACDDPPELPYIDIDYSDDGDFEGGDVLVYSRFWRQSQGNPAYNVLADLAPSTPDGIINAKDLLAYLNLFQQRDLLPHSIALPPPLLETPDDGVFYPPEAQGQNIHFSWTPQDNAFADPVLWELEIETPDGGPPKPFFTAEPEYFTHFIPEGLYVWRVRSYAADGTRGEWSLSRSFMVGLGQYQPPNPDVIGPSDGAVLPAGAVQFEWTRSDRSGLYGVFDRIEIQNGEGPIVGLDIYHRQSELGAPTVVNKIPLAMNFGPDFRWRARTFYVIQDTFFRLYPVGTVETPAWHPFTLQGDPKLLGGLGAWNPDPKLDGHLNVFDLSQFGKGWKAGRETAPSFVQEADLDYDFEVTPLDYLKLRNAWRQGVHMVVNGSPIPFPLFPIETPGQPPFVFPVNMNQNDAARGTRLVWGQVPGVTKYLAEWIDSEDEVFAIYATKLPAPSLISPVGDQLVTVPSIDGNLTLTWSVAPDAQKYFCILENLTTHLGADTPIIVEAGPSTDTTISTTLSGETLANTYGGVGNYEWRVQPFGVGHFADTSVFETFSLSFTKDGSDYYAMSHPVAKQRPGIVVNAEAIIPAFGHYGLYSWRVMGLSNDFSAISAPSQWNRFGIQCLGPAFGGEVFCGQTPGN
jgi:hypothetical protein